MSTPTPTLSKPASLRRTRYAVQTIALLFAVTMCCIFVGLIGDRYPKRFDATATREHHLAPRTLDLLATLDGDYELVVAANFSTLDPQAVRRTQDVLDNFARATPHIKTTIIDVASSRGLNDLDALTNRLLDRFSTDLEKQKTAVQAALQSAVPLADGLNVLSEELLATSGTVLDTDPNAATIRAACKEHAARCRVAAEDLNKAASQAKELLGKTIGHSTVPATDDAVTTLRLQLSNALATASAAGDQLDALTHGTPDIFAKPTSDRAKPAAQAATRLRKDIADALTRVQDLPRTPVSSVLRVLERTSAAIVIAPPGSARNGVTSIELSAIYPPKPPDGATVQQVDLRAKTEELLAGAIASLARADTPIVVFVHGQSRKMAPDFIPVLPEVERLRLRGVDFAEWAAGLDTEPPQLRSIDPQAKRPVVYVVIAKGPGSAEEAAQFGKLLQAVGRLIADGKSVLLTQVPSNLPSVGRKDPLADLVTPLGINVDSGRPLLHQATGPRGRVVTGTQVIADAQTDHPIAQAIRGLTLDLPWCLPVHIAEGSPARPVIVIDAQKGQVWAESEFAGFIQVPENEQPGVANPPAPGTGDDLGETLQIERTSGGKQSTVAVRGWPIAATVERSVAGRQQRVLVVGSTKWMSAEVTGLATNVEGRIVPTFPGNLELFDASVFWLAGQDAMIAASPEARATPTIPPLSEGQIAALRWGLIGGLPITILLIGALWRLASG